MTPTRPVDLSATTAALWMAAATLLTARKGRTAMNQMREHDGTSPIETTGDISEFEVLELAVREPADPERAVHSRGPTAFLGVKLAADNRSAPAIQY
jgi:hypothetical protein